MPLPFLHDIPVLSHIVLFIQSADQAEDVKKILEIAFYAAFSVILPFVLGALSDKKLTPALRYFFYLVAFTLFTESTGLILGWVDSENLWLYNTYTAVEYSLLILMFTQLHEGKRFRRLLLGSIPVFIVIWIIATFFLEATDDFHGVFLSVESVVFVIIAVITLVKEMSDSTVLLVDNPIFWVSAGVLVYFAGNLLVFAFIDQLLKETLENSQVGMYSGWLIHTAMNVTKNILYAIAFLSTGGPSESLRSGVQFMKKKIRSV